MVEIDPVGWLFAMDVSGRRIGQIVKGQAVLDELFSDCLTSECVTDVLLSLNFLVLEDGPTYPETSVIRYPKERLNGKRVFFVY